MNTPNESDGVPNTVTEAIELLRSRGYVLDYELVDGQLCTGDLPSCPIGEVHVDKVYRFEGPSDPGDEMIVFALHDRRVDARGVLASAFGHAADPEVREHLSGLHHRWQ